MRRRRSLVSVGRKSWRGGGGGEGGVAGREEAHDETRPRADLDKRRTGEDGGDRPKLGWHGAGPAGSGGGGEASYFFEATLVEQFNKVKGENFAELAGKFSGSGSLNPRARATLAYLRDDFYNHVNADGCRTVEAGPRGPEDGY